MSATFDAGTGILTVTGDGADSLGVGVDESFVAINGSTTGIEISNSEDASQTEVSTQKVKRIVVTGGSGANTIDLSGVGDAFIQLISVSIDGGGGNDSITGSQREDSITGGAGNDSLNGGEGGDTYLFDLDSALDSDTIVEADDGGTDALDFSNTTDSSVGLQLELSSTAAQIIRGNVLTLTLSDTDVIENVIGGSGADTITGNTADNDLDGGDGDDSIVGDEGADSLTGGTGDDFLGGGTGNDSYLFADGWGMDTVSESTGEGTDSMDFSSVTVALTVSAETGVVTETDDSNIATPERDQVETIVGGEGNDLFVFEDGVEFAGASGAFDGGFGTDTLDYSAYTTAIEVDLSTGIATGLGSGQVGFEGVVGGSASDTITGDDDDNRLEGGAGNDTITGGDGDDVYVYSGTASLGSDLLVEVADEGSDTVDFSERTSSITFSLASYGSAQTIATSTTITLSDADTTAATETFENVIGGEGNDTLTGNALGNQFTGGAGNDSLTGGAGNDTYFFDADTTLGNDTINEVLSNGGTDELNFSATQTAVAISLTSSSTQTVVSSNLTIAYSVNNSVENVTGGEGADTIIGSEYANTLTGGAGNDTIKGESGNDLLEGGTGNDYLLSGGGDDQYVFADDWGSDTLLDYSGAGTDTLDFSAVSDSLTVAIGSSSATVSEGTNTVANIAYVEALLGGSGDDLFSFANTATFASSLGTLDGGDGSDTLSYSAYTTAVSVNLSTGTATGTAGVSQFENVIGGSENDSLTGDANANQFTGNGGNDSLTGNAGDDTYWFDADATLGSDTINESGGGSDLLDFSATTAAIIVNLSTATAQTVVSGNLSLTLSSSSTIEKLTGGAGGDSLTGNSADNTLGGGAGNDSLNGNGGSDTYLFQAGWGSDTIAADDNPLVSVTGSVTLASATGGVTATMTTDTSASIFIPAPGETGTVSVNADETITVTTLSTNGASIKLDANDVAIQENATISTRVIGAGLDQLNSASTGDSGDLTITGTHITIPSGASLLTHVETGSAFAAGEIKLKASDIDFLLYGTSRARIDLNNATLRGGNITIEALADNDAVFGGELSDAEKLGETLLDKLASLNLLFGGNDVAAVASVEVSAGTTIVSSGDVSITAQANSGSDVFVLGALVGVAYSRSQADARVNVETGVSISAVGSVTLDAYTDNKANAFATTLTATPIPLDLFVVVAETYSTATTEVEAGATITAGADITARAKNERDISVLGSGGSGSDLLALTFVVNVALSRADVSINGTLQAGGDIDVLARSITLENETGAKSTIKDSLFQNAFDARLAYGASGTTAVAKSLTRVIEAAIGRFKQSQLTKNGLAAAIGVAIDSNRATATIGNSAIVQASGNVTVEARITHDFETSAAGEIGGVSVLSGTVPVRRRNAAAAGIMLGLVDNDASAVIEAGAKVDASQTLTVNALTENPYEEDFSDFALPHSSLGDRVSNLAEKLNANLGIKNGFFSSWAQASADGEGVSVAFSANVVNVANNAKARIQSGAKINQDVAYRTTVQDVVVKADNLIETVNLSGVVRFFFENLGSVNRNLFGTSGDKAAIGGSLLSISYQNTAEASIGAATVHADDVTVKADTQTSNISFVASGGSSSGSAINGSGALGLIQNETTAFIESGAVITAGGDVQVTATDDAFLLNLAGTVVKGTSTPANGSVAAGASFVVNTLERETTAYIGTESGTGLSTSGVQITAAGNIDVTAENTGLVLGLALAAAVTAPATADPTDPLDGLSLQGLFGDAPTGVGVAGDAVVNVTRDSAEAYIRDVGTVMATGALRIEADNRTDTAAFSGAVTATAPGSAPTTGIAGSFSSNGIDNDTRAFIESATVTASALTVSAEQTGLILAISAGGSGSALSVGTNVAGSVAVNIVLPTTEAYVSNATITLANASSITASDTTQIWSIAGALGYGGQGGYGVGVALNLVGFSNDTETIPNQPAVTRAFIEDSIITLTSGTLTVEATADNPSFEPRIVSIAGSAGITTSAGSTGGAGMVAVNVIKGTTEAFVSDSEITETTASTTASLKIHARDDSRIHAIGGAVGVGSSFGFGAAVGYNEIHSTTRASLDDTDVTLSGSVNITADSVSEIANAVLGVAVGTGTGIAGAGSAGVNQITNTIEASITGASNVTVAGAVTVQATDRSQIVSITGGVAGTLTGSAAVGAAVSYNLISNAVTAFIDSSTVTSAALSVAATSEPLLVAIALGGAGAQSFALGGSLTVNSIANTVDAHVAGTTGSSAISTGGDVSVTAAEKASMYVIAGAAAVSAAGVGAFGASLAYNYVGGNFDPENPNAISYNSGQHGSTNPSANAGNGKSSLTAYIDNASVDAGGRVLVASGYDAPTLVPLARQSFDPVNAVDQSSDTITLSTHGLETGDAVEYSKGSVNTAIGGLTDSTTYYVIRVSETQVKLATSAENAEAGTAIDLTSVGSGTGHLLAPQLDLVVTAITPAAVTSQITNVTVAGAGTAGSGFALGGAVSINVIRADVDAHISNTPTSQAVEANGAVQVLATDTSQLNAGTGGFAFFGAATVAIAVGVADIANQVQATIDDAVVRSTGDAVEVSATETARIVNAAMGVSVSGIPLLGFSGSVAANEIANTVKARIQNGSNVQAAGSVTLQAEDTASIAALAGNVVYAGVAGVAGGTAFSVNNIHDTVLAKIDGSSVKSTSGDIVLDSRFAEPDDLPDGLDAQIASLAVSGVMSGSSIGTVAGSVALNWIRNTVESTISDVDAEQTGSDTIQADAGAIRLHAADDSTINSVAGAEADTGDGAAIGASVSYNFLGGDPDDPDATGQNVVSAGIDSSSGAIQAGTIEIQATYTGTINNLTQAGSDAGNFALGGSIALNRIQNRAEAFIAESSNVSGTNLVTLAAHDTSIVRSLSGQWTDADNVATGAALAYNDINNELLATVIDSTVTSSAGSVAIEAQSDSTIETLAAGVALSKTGALAGSSVANLIGNIVRAKIDGSTVAADDNLTLLAETDNTIKAFAGAISKSSTVAAIGGSVVVNQSKNTTEAFINDSTVSAIGNGDTTNVKTWASNDDGTQSTEAVRGLTVIATATENFDVIGVTASVAGGTTGVGVAVNSSVNRVNDTTKAYIDHSAVNSATSRGNDVRVRAHQKTNITSAVGVLGAGIVGVGAAADHTLLANETKAFVADTTVYVSGDVFVTALTRETVETYANGAGLAAVALAGAGSSVRSTSLTSAFVEGATIYADSEFYVLANSRIAIDFYDGVLAGGTGVGAGASVAVAEVLTTTTAYLAEATTGSGNVTTVRADSEEDINVLVGTVAAGGGAAVAGAVAVVTLASETLGAIQDGSTVTTGSVLTVRADNQTDVNDKVGTLSGSFSAAIAGSIDVIRVKNSVDAHIGSDATVTAGFDVTVEATATRNVDSSVVTLGASTGGAVSGAVSVISIGTGLSSQAKDQTSSSLRTLVNDSSGSAGEGVDNGASDGVGAEAADVADQDRTNVTFETDTTTAGTIAYIGVGATVTATNDDITVVAKETVTVDGIAGGIAIGSIGGFGGSVMLVNIGSTTRAYVGNSTVLSAKDDIAVLAYFTNTTKADAYGAAAGGVAALGAQVAIITDSSQQSAFVDDGTKYITNDDDTVSTDGAQIVKADDVTIQADNTSKLDAEVKGLTVGGSYVAGLSWADVTKSGSTKAYLGNYAQVGQGTDTVGDLTVLATTDLTVKARSAAATGGLGYAGNGSVSKAVSYPTVSASLGDSSKVEVTGHSTIHAFAYGTADSKAVGSAYSGTIAIGVSEATAEWSPNVNASLGDHALLDAGDKISLQAGSNGTYDSRDESRFTTATAEASTGGTLAGAGALSYAYYQPKVLVNVGSDAQLTADETLVIAVRMVGDTVDSNATGKLGGLVSAGFTKAIVGVADTAIIQTGDGVEFKATAIVFQSDIDINASSDAVGGNGGLIEVGGATANIYVDKHQSQVLLGDTNTIDAGTTGSVNIVAFDSSTFTSNAQLKAASGFLGVNEVDARVRDDRTITGNSKSSLNTKTEVSVGNSSSITANTVGLQALNLASHATAKSESDSVSAVDFSNATSIVYWTPQTLTSVGADTQINAPASIDIVAFQASGDSVEGDGPFSGFSFGVTSTSIADAKIEGLAGDVLAASYNYFKPTTKVQTGDGSTFSTRDLYVQSQAASQAGYVVEADADNKTVFKYITEKVGESCDSVLKFLGFGKKVTKKVCKDIKKVVGQIPLTQENEEYHGSYNDSQLIDFNSHVTLLAPTNSTATLTADENENLTKSNVTADLTSDSSLGTVIKITEVVVSTASPRGITFSTPLGSISGNATFDIQAVEKLTVNNVSNKGLLIDSTTALTESSDTAATNAPFIDIDATTEESGWYAATGSFANTIVINNSGQGRVYVNDAGDITVNQTYDGSDGGTTTLRVGYVIARNGGTVVLTSPTAIIDVQEDASADVYGGKVAFSVTAGSIGDSSNPIELYATSLLDATATSGNIYLTVYGSNSVPLGKVTAGGEVWLVSGGGILDAQFDDEVDIQGSKLFLAAGGQIGGSTNAIETDIDLLEAVFTGDLFVTNTGNLQIGGGSTSYSGITNNGSSSGSVGVTTSGSMTVNEDITTYGPITLTTVDASGTGQNLTVASNVTMTASNGSIELRAGDDLTLSGSLKLGTSQSLTLTGDYGNADSGTGSVIAVNQPTLGYSNSSTSEVNVSISTSSDNDSIAVNLPTDDGSQSNSWKVTVDGSGGSDQITVDDSSSSSSDTVKVLTTGGVTLDKLSLNYSSTEKLIVTLGASADDITLSSTSTSTSIEVYGNGGNDTAKRDFSYGFINVPLLFKGGAGDDSISLSYDANFALTADTLTLSSGSTTSVITLAGVEGATLTGGDSANTFTVNGWNGSATLNGGGGTDSLKVTEDANVKLTNTSLTRSNNEGTLTLSGFENANLTGGAEANKFDLDDWGGNATLSGGSGIDTFTIAFTNSSGTLVVSGDDGGDTVTIDGAIVASSVSITADSITVNAAITVSGTGQLTLDANGGSAGNVSVNAALNSNKGAITLRADNNLLASSAGSITTTSGVVTLVADDDSNGSGSISYGAAISHGSGGTSFSLSGTTSTVSGVLSGTGGITKSGSGTLKLTGSNTFTGTTQINAGTLQLGAANVLSDSTLVSLANTAGAVFDLNNYSETIAAMSGSGSKGGNVSLGSGTLTVGTATSTTYSGVISGTGSLVKQGTGTLTLAGANSYSGATTINAGTLKLGASNVIANISDVTVATGAFLDLNSYSETIDGLSGYGTLTNSSSTSATLTLGSNNQGSSSFDGPITNSLALIKSGTGTQILNGENSYTGTTTISAGTLKVGHSKALGSTGTSSGTSVTAGATLQVSSSNGITVAEPITSLAGTLQNVSGTNTWSGSIAITAATFQVDTSSSLTLSGKLTGSNGFKKTGDGVLQLTNTSNSYSGTTTISAGELELGAAGVIPDSSSVTLANVSGAFLDLNNFNETISSLSGGGTTGGNVTLGSGTLTISEISYQEYAGVVSGSGGLTKQGAGTLGLSGSNTYTGSTTIKAGSLRILADERLSNSTDVTVFSGATLNLGGKSETIDGLSGSGDVKSNQTGTMTFTVGANNETAANYSGSLYNGSGTVNLVKTGTGTQTLSGTGSNSHNTTTVNGGTLVLAKTKNATAIPGSLTVGDSDSTDESTDTVKLAVANQISDKASVTLKGIGVLDLAGYSDGIDMLAGTGSVKSDLSGATAELTVGTNNGTSSFSGTIENGLGTVSLRKKGTGVFTLAGDESNTYTGTTTVQQGTLELSKTNVTAIMGSLVIGDGTNSATAKLNSGTQIDDSTDVTINSQGTLDLNGQSETIDGLFGAGNVTNNGTAASTLSVGAGKETTATFSGVIKDGSSKTVALTKTGTGTQTLSGKSTYTGTTNISQGTLDVDGSLASPIVIGSSGTLTGSGTISGGVSGSGTNSFGNSPGFGIVNSNFTLQSSSEFVVELEGTTAGTEYDQLRITGATSTLTLNNARLILLLGLDLADGSRFTIVNIEDNSLPVNGTFAGLPEGATFLVGSTQFTITYQGGSGNDIVLTLQSPTDTTTDVTLDGSGNLVISDVAAGGKNDSLTVQFDETDGMYVITDPTSLLQTTIGQAEGSGTSQIRVPFLAVTGANIDVQLLGGNDSLAIDFSQGGFPKSINVNGGSQVSGRGDTLRLTGGTVTDAIFGFTDADRGTINLTGNGSISYAGLEGLKSELGVSDLVLNYSGASETIEFSPTIAQTRATSTAGKTLLFNNPTGSLAVNSGAGNDNIVVRRFGAGFGAALIVNGGTGTDKFDLQTQLTLVEDADFRVTADSIVLGDASSVSTSGTGEIELSAEKDILMRFRSSLTTEDGGIKLVANPLGMANGEFSGISLITASITTTGQGNIELNGTGGKAAKNDQYGIQLRHNSAIESTASGADAGMITIDGTGGNGTGFDYGVLLTADNSRITSVDGDIQITGQGGKSATGEKNVGVAILNGAQVRSKGTTSDAAKITIAGTGGAGSNSNIGVVVDLNSAVASFNGDLQITGQGGSPVTGNNNGGVIISRNSTVSSLGDSSDAATITISGTSTGIGAATLRAVLVEGVGTRVTSVNGEIDITGNGTIGEHFNAGTSGRVESTGAASITLHGNRMTIDSTAELKAPLSTVSLVPSSVSTVIDLVDSGINSRLSLSDAVLDRVTAATLVLGSASQTGGIIVSSAITPAGTSHLELVTGGAISQNFSGTGISVTELGLTAPNGIGSASSSLTVNVEALSTSTVGGNANQYLREVDLLSWNGSSAGTGMIDLNGGLFRVAEGQTVNASTIYVNDTAILGGKGTINAAIFVASGGIYSPGTSPGIFDNAGNLTLNANSTLDIEVRGGEVGSDYDRIVVTGTVELGNAPLNVILGVIPVSGAEYTIIDNDGSDSIQNEFADLAEGATFDVTSEFGETLVFSITYIGGDGNDVLLRLANQAPQSDAGGLYQVTAGGGVLLDASDTFDPDQETATLTFAWDFDGDGVFGETGTTYGDEIGMTPTFLAVDLDAPTEVVVSLSVTDDHGEIDSTIARINVINAAPEIVTLAPVGESEENQFSTIQITISDAEMELDTESFTFSIDWGDGVTDDGTAILNALGMFDASHKYADSGLYDVTVSIQDDDLDLDVQTFSLTVNNVAADIAVDSDSVTVNEGQTADNTGVFGDSGPDSVALSASIGSVVDNGDGTWSWSFDSSNGSAESQRIRITANDEDGGSSFIEFDLTVANLAPTVILNGPTSATVGNTLSYSFTVSDPGLDTFNLLEIDGGAGGAISLITFDPSTGSGSFDCTFLDGSTSTVVSVQVEDSDFASSNTASVTVVVGSAAAHDDPEITGELEAQAVTDRATIAPFREVTIEYAKLPPESLSILVTLDVPAQGVLTNLGSFIDQGGGQYSFTGTADAATAAIRTLRFNPTDNHLPVASTETTTFTISVATEQNTVRIGDGTTVVTTFVGDVVIADAGGPYSIDAGMVLLLDASASNGNLNKFQWDINGDGKIDLTSTTAQTRVPWQTLANIGVGAGTVTPKLTVTDTRRRTAKDTTTLNVSSTFRYSATSDGTADRYTLQLNRTQLEIRDTSKTSILSRVKFAGIEQVVITGGSDADTMTLDFGYGGSPLPQTGVLFDGGTGVDTLIVKGSRGTVGDQFSFTSDATGRLLLTAPSAAGRTTTSANIEQLQVFVQAGNDVVLLDDLNAVTGLTSVMVDGGDGHDTLNGFDAAGDVDAGLPLSLLGGSGNDVLHGSSGNDTMNGQSGTDRLFGNDGDDHLLGATENDTLDGGAGNDILDGGAGADSLVGGIGRDLLIGGAAIDVLSGGADEDILIGGTTSYDTNATALTAIMAEWTSVNTYETRIANLRDTGVANGSIKLKMNTVRNDSNAADKINGSFAAPDNADLDWFFQSAGDVMDAIIGEVRTTI